jgi:hypothetical protein
MIGQISGKHWSVVVTYRGQKIRIIDQKFDDGQDVTETWTSCTRPTRRMPSHTSGPLCRMVPPDGSPREHGLRVRKVCA